MLPTLERTFGPVFLLDLGRHRFPRKSFCFRVFNRRNISRITTKTRVSNFVPSWKNQRAVVDHHTWRINCLRSRNVIHLKKPFLNICLSFQIHDMLNFCFNTLFFSVLFKYRSVPYRMIIDFNTICVIACAPTEAQDKFNWGRDKLKTGKWNLSNKT